MHRLINIFIVVDIVLATVAVCVWLLPAHTKDTPNIMTTSIATDSVSHANVKEQQVPHPIQSTATEVSPSGKITAARYSNGTYHVSQENNIPQTSPFYKEAAKIVSGKMSEEDASNRRVILNYCEHLRTAYTTKDIDFIRQVFSEKALIIVGNVIKEQTGRSVRPDIPNERVLYYIRSKQQYLAGLRKVFAANAIIDVGYSDFHIYRHPTMDGIYGVTLRQKYHSDRYSDDGYLFLLWDFRTPSMPMIHVRVWQAAAALHDGDDVISLSDFNLE